MLWGTVAIAAPIAIFLLSRFRYKKVAGDTERDAPENVELIRRLLVSD